MEHYDILGWAKVVLLWCMAVLGAISLSQLTLFAALILSILQGWKTWKEIKRLQREESKAASPGGEGG